MPEINKPVESMHRVHAPIIPLRTPPKTGFLIKRAPRSLDDTMTWLSDTRKSMKPKPPSSKVKKAWKNNYPVQEWDVGDDIDRRKEIFIRKKLF